MRPEKEECECAECGNMFPDRRAYNAHRRQEHTEEKHFECEECHKAFTTPFNLETHRLLHSGEKRFQCNECARPFARKGDLRKHMRVHTGEKPFGCKECGRRFAQSNSLYGHKCWSEKDRDKVATAKSKERSSKQRKKICVESSSSEDELPRHRRRPPVPAKTIECEECELEFGGRRAYNAHVRQVHAKKKVFECDECDYKCGKLSDLKRHMLVHTGDHRFKRSNKNEKISVDDSSSDDDFVQHRPTIKCEKCDEEFDGRSAFNAHMCQVPAEKKVFDGKRGDYKSDKPSNLESHMLIETGERRVKRSEQNKEVYVDGSSSEDDLVQHRPTIECEECEFEFGSRRAYNAHMRQVHAEKKVYECDTCAYKSDRPSSLKQHMLVHTGEKRFKCEQCGKPFAREGDLQKHMRLQAEKPYECTQCGRRFNHSSSLRGHKCAGESPKPYGCNECAYKCSKSSNIKQHMLVHTRERRFKCRVCGKAFARKGDLDKHTRIHTGEKPYGCDECGRRFAQSRTLHGHKCVKDVDVGRRSERDQESAFDTSSSDDDFPEERRQAHSDRNWNKQRSFPGRKRGLDYASSSVKSPSEKRQRQEARPSAPTGADRPKFAGPLTDLNSYLKAQHSKLENELRRGAGLEKRSADDVDESCDSATSTSPSELQDLRETADAMEEHYADDFDYESLML